MTLAIGPLPERRGAAARPARHTRARLAGLAALAISLVASAEPSVAIPAGPAPRDLGGVGELRLSPVDAAAARGEDELRAAMGLPVRFALPESTWVTPGLAGSWERRGRGELVWRLRILAPGATSLGLGFSGFRLPSTARLRVLAPDLVDAMPLLTAADEDAHGELWTPALPGDQILLELVLDEAELPALELELTTVARGYRPLFGGESAAASGACNVDVVCPEAEPWSDQIGSVALLAVGGSEVCTGFLVNNSAQDGLPLVLTSASCGINEENDASVVAYWRYENPTCRTAGGGGGGTQSIYSSGAIFRARVSATDTVLIELDDPVPTEADAFLAGWDRRSADPASAVAIHHPQTEEKRISFENDPLSTTSYLGSASPGDGTHLRVDDWDLGTTEGGSGGAPLFSPEGLAVGLLHGGFAACGNQEPDWFGRISYAWSAGATREARLRDWLDPLGTGATTLTGVAIAATRVPPAAPTALSALALSAEAITLTWNDNSNNESVFVVEAREVATAFTEIARLPPNTATTTVAGLASNTTYVFRVRAENPWGQSAWTNEASAATFGTTEPCVRDERTACLLDERFEVRVSWATVDGSGDGLMMRFSGERAESDQSAFFTFFDPANFEMGVKLADACGFTGKYWVFVSGLTNQAFTVLVRDTANGRIRTYTNPLGVLPQTVGDTSALDCQVAAGSPDGLLFVPVARLEPPGPATEAVEVAGPDIRVEPLTLALGGVAPKTIRVEIDWMAAGTHSHQPSAAVLEEIAATFAAAGYEIVLELGNSVPHQDVLDLTGFNLVGSPAMQAIVDQHFAHQEDPDWFYSLWIHNHSWFGVPTTSSGTADAPPGRWSLVSLGSFAGEVGTFSNQVGTFLHVLGHNLGQTHSGQDQIASRHHMPNYLSVMNERYQLAGIGPTLLAQGLADSADGFDDFSYSHGLLPPLEESALDERAGLGLGKAVDWDCDGVIESSVQHELREDDWCAAAGTNYRRLEDFDNWRDLAAYVPDPSGAAAPHGSTLAGEVAAAGEERSRGICSGVTYEAFAPLEARLETLRAAGRLAPDGPRPRRAAANPEAATTSGAAGYFTVHNDGDAPLTVTGLVLDLPTPWLHWSPEAPFTVRPGGAQRVFLRANLTEAPAGLTTRRLLVYSDDPDESPYPGGVTIEVDGRGSTTACVRDAETACLLADRFEVRIGWQTATAAGTGAVMAFDGARAESDQSAFYWFFNPENFEMGVKMVDACVPPFDSFWAFVSGLTNQAYGVSIRDTATGRVRTYQNPLGTYPQTVGDTSAFPCE